MSTHTHTRAEGTGGSINKFRVTTQNMGGFGLEVRSHKNRTKTGPKMQYLRKSAERNATDVFVLTETRIKTTAECKNIRKTHYDDSFWTDCSGGHCSNQ